MSSNIAINTVIGAGLQSSNNRVIVSGSNSVWTSGSVYVGSGGAQNQYNSLQITNGGTVYTYEAVIGSQSSSSNNFVIVSGSNSTWTTFDLFVGAGGTGNTLLISNGGIVSTYGQGVSVGYSLGSAGNLVTVSGGTLSVTNGGTGVIDIRRGTNVLNAGLIDTDQLVLTNSAGYFVFNGGSLNVRTSTVANAQTFVVGNGISAGKFNSVGGGTQSFANGLLIQSNSTLAGSGTINGTVTNCGTISLTNVDLMTFTGLLMNKGVINSFGKGFVIQTNATLTGFGAINGIVTNLGTIFLTNADLMTFTGQLVNKGVIIAMIGTPHFGATFTNLGTLVTTESIRAANISVSGTSVVVQFNTVSNYLHEVQMTTNVASGVWQSLTNGIIGTGSPTNFTHLGGALTTNRAYRVLMH